MAHSCQRCENPVASTAKIVVHHEQCWWEHCGEVASLLLAGDDDDGEDAEYPQTTITPGRGDRG